MSRKFCHEVDGRSESSKTQQSDDGLVGATTVRNVERFTGRDVNKLCLMEGAQDVSGMCPTANSPRVGGGPSGLANREGPLRVWLGITTTSLSNADQVRSGETVEPVETKQS